MSTDMKSPPTFIDPDRLYSLRGFQEASGISATRIREGRRQGVSPKWIKVGRRKFLHGVDAIEYVQQLAQVGPRKRPRLYATANLSTGPCGSESLR